jgi:hypothetical protein
MTQEMNNNNDSNNNNSLFNLKFEHQLHADWWKFVAWLQLSPLLWITDNALRSIILLT